ncbi:hypothetical protein WIW50_06550 [Flavobacteriaceae bacterium 3-367]|uniref:hypothetical protein n=1 Tax=Eudoraea algarum TaxID=3417568 RepID=UPI00327486B4
MKKQILPAIFVLALVFNACSDDNDDNGNCESCSIEGQNVEICDNGDGTYTFTSGEESDTISSAELLGLTPKQFVDLLCTAQ